MRMTTASWRTESLRTGSSKTTSLRTGSRTSRASPRAARAAQRQRKWCKPCRTKARKGSLAPGSASTSGAFRNIETRSANDLAIAASGEAAPTQEASRRGDAPDTGEISIAIIGRPNVGKSSLVNRLLKEERVMVSPLAGTTRDPIDTVLRWHGRDLRIIDTAGIRRAGKVANSAHVEAVSVVLARRAIARADVAVLLIDSVEGPTDQDAAIAGEAERAGCGVIIVANKWDLMKGRGVNFSKEFDENLRRRLKFLEYAPVMHLSAMTGERTPKLLEMIERVAKSRHTRVSTGALNRFVDGGHGDASAGQS